MVVLKVTPTTTKIEGLEDLDVIDSLSSALSYYEPGYRYSMAFKMKKWDGRNRLLQRSLKFPTGLLAKVEGILKKKGIDYSLDILYAYPDSNDSLKWEGPKLYPYQEDAVDTALFKKGGMIKIATGGGKAQPLDAKLLTPTGWSRMGDIQVGDHVISQDGTPTVVTGVFPQGTKSIYRVVFSDGSTTECCDEHLWLTKNANERQRNKAGKVRSLQEIRNSVLCHNGTRRNHHIPMCEPISFEQDNELPLDPYLLGVLLGDGSFRHQLKISTADQEIIDEIRPTIESKGCTIRHIDRYDFSIINSPEPYAVRPEGARRNANLIKTAVTSLGLWGHKSDSKFIPKEYLFATIDNRISLLQGLLDTDGTINSRGDKVTFCTTSERLSADVQFLVQSLGGTAYTAERITQYTNRDGERVNGLKSYRTTVKLSNDIPCFRLQRKRRQVRPATKYFPRRIIDRVEYVGEKPAQCISVEHPSRLYLTDNCIVTHNTMIISALVGDLNHSAMIYVVSLDLLSQMQETLEETLGIEVGVIGGGQCDIKDVNVCSVWTAGLAFGQKFKKSYEDEIVSDTWDPGEEQRARIREAVENAKIAILDEAQFAAASSIQMIMKNSKSAVYKFGFTATPWRTSGDDILLEAVFGERIVDINASKLIDMGYLVPPKIAFRDVPEYPKNLPKKWPAVKSNYINKNDERNELLIRNTTKLLEMGRRPLLLFREHAHGNTLMSMMPPDVRTRMVTGRLARDERDLIRQEFQAGLVDCILASTVYDQGIDIKELDALVLCAGGKSTAKALQRIGRVIRANHEGGKKDAYVVETFDQTHFVEDHSLIRYDIYRTEPAFQLKLGPAMQARCSRRRK